MRISFPCIVVLLVLVVVPFAALQAATEEVCEVEYESPDRPNRAFGVPYNVFSSAHELLIRPRVCTENTSAVVFGNNDLNTQLYEVGYYWDGNAWQRLNFISSNRSAGWIRGEALAVVPNVGKKTMVVAYLCQDTPAGVRCGCRDTACSGSKWMLQQIVTEKETLTRRSSSRDDDEVVRRSSRDKWLMAYYPGWDEDRLPRRRIPWEMMTHIAVGIAAPRSDGTLLLEFDKGSLEAGEEFATRLARDAKSNDVVPILMIGGGSGNWELSTSDALVKKYARNIVEAMDDFGFDGVDIDWEPLESRHLPAVAALAKELRRLEPDMILTIAAPYRTINQGPQSEWYGDNAHLFDQINIMTYDMSGAWPGWNSWHHSALFGEGATYPTSIESSVEAYTDAGVDKKKLGIGVPFYGRCWEGVGGPKQVGGVTNGPMSYRLIRREYYDRDDLEWDSNAKASYLSFERPTGPDDCTFITYAEELDASTRGEYIVDEGLGGAIVWSLGQAYMDENSRSKRHPLLRAIWNELE